MDIKVSHRHMNVFEEDEIEKIDPKKLYADDDNDSPAPKADGGDDLNDLDNLDLNPGKDKDGEEDAEEAAA
jgi:hypothetical protein